MIEFLSGVVSTVVVFLMLGALRLRRRGRMFRIARSGPDENVQTPEKVVTKLGSENFSRTH